MRLVSLTCPNCGASFGAEINPDRGFCFCSSCGSRLYFDDGIKRTEHVEVKVDKARIHEADVKKEIYMKKIEKEDSERTKRRNLLLIKIFTPVGFLLAELLFYVLACYRCDAYGYGDSAGLTFLTISNLLFLISFFVVIPIWFYRRDRK